MSKETEEVFIKKKNGLKEIDDAKWQKGEYDELNLYVHDTQGNKVHCWLELRQHYCDRGHIQFNIDCNLSIDSADSFPRFFFSQEEAKKHVKDFLKWRIWKHRSYPQVLEE